MNIPLLSRGALALDVPLWKDEKTLPYRSGAAPTGALGRAWRSLLWTLYISSLAGIAISIWAHVVSILGGDPRAQCSWIWAVQMLLFFLLAPIVLTILRKRGVTRLFFPSRRVRVGLYALLAYYGVHFYVFLVLAAEHLADDVTWRMFSAGWLLLFSVAAAFYSWHLSQSGVVAEPSHAM